MSAAATPMSLNEIGFYFTRAAVGAGAPFGLGEDFAETSRWAAYLGFDPAAAAVPALRGLADGGSGICVDIPTVGKCDFRREPRRPNPVRHLCGPGSCRPAAGRSGARRRMPPVARRNRPAAADRRGRGLGRHSCKPDCNVLAVANRRPDRRRSEPRRRRPDRSGRRRDCSARSCEGRDCPEWRRSPRHRRSSQTRTIRLAEGRSGAVERGVVMDGTAWLTVYDYFSKCLVPSTGRSRTAGAGAGKLTDNC